MAAVAWSMSDTGNERFARYFPYLEAYLEVRISATAVTCVRFPSEVDPEMDAEHPLLDRVEDYLSGTIRDDFRDVDVSLNVGNDEATLYRAVRNIPFGEDVSVEDLARDLPEFDVSQSEDHDRIRELLDRNPIPLIIPDHRVRDAPSAAPPEIEQRLRSLENR